MRTTEFMNVTELQDTTAFAEALPKSPDGAAVHRGKLQYDPTHHRTGEEVKQIADEETAKEQGRRRELVQERVKRATTEEERLAILRASLDFEAGMAGLTNLSPGKDKASAQAADQTKHEGASNKTSVAEAGSQPGRIEGDPAEGVREQPQTGIDGLIQNWEGRKTIWNSKPYLGLAILKTLRLLGKGVNKTIDRFSKAKNEPPVQPENAETTKQGSSILIFGLPVNREAALARVTEAGITVTRESQVGQVLTELQTKDAAAWVNDEKTLAIIAGAIDLVQERANLLPEDLKLHRDQSILDILTERWKLAHPNIPAVDENGKQTTEYAVFLNGNPALGGEAALKIDDRIAAEYAKRFPQPTVRQKT